MGKVAQGNAILRSQAKAGNGIFVTGALGGAAGGLILLDGDIDKSPRLKQRQLKPWPEIEYGKLLMSLGLVTSMIDVSDGLASDLLHICESSGVGTVIYHEKVPVDRDLLKFFAKDEAFEMAMNGGEDYELLFTGRAEDVLAAGIIGISLIGEITEKPGEYQIEKDGELNELRCSGFKHF
jgi:thiamine-monophosphate kinase